MRKIDTRDFRRATRSTSRQVNRQILLNLVREHQPISRADLARRMTLGRGVVTTLVKELLEEGALYEGALGDLPRGRRPMMLHVQTRDRLVVAIDVRFSRTSVPRSCSTSWRSACAGCSALTRRRDAVRGSGW